MDLGCWHNLLIDLVSQSPRLCQLVKGSNWWALPQATMYHMLEIQSCRNVSVAGYKVSVDPLFTQMEKYTRMNFFDRGVRIYSPFQLGGCGDGRFFALGEWARTCAMILPDKVPGIFYIHPRESAWERRVNLREKIQIGTKLLSPQEHTYIVTFLIGVFLISISLTLYEFHFCFPCL